MAAHLDRIANDRMVKVAKFAEVKDNLNAVARATRNVLLSQDPAYEAQELKKIETLRSRTSDALAELDKSAVLPKGRALLARIVDARTPYLRGVDAVLELDRNGRRDAAAEMLIKEVAPHQVTLFEAVDESTEMQRTIAAGLAAKALADARSNALTMLGLAVAGVLIGSAVALTIARRLTRTLGAEPAQLRDAAQRVAEGDLTDLGTGRTAADDSVMGALAAMQRDLAAVVGRVRTASESVATGSSQIASGNTDLSQRTEEQASALEETSATMEQLGGTVRNNADVARQADDMAREAAEVAARGGATVGDVVSTMHKISDSSRQIEEIIGVIDGIAFQTNILALNAAVEAARAGEQGRGFAVVASEVRTLAQRSAEAAKQIKGLIAGNVAQVQEGTGLVGRAGETMHEVVGAIRRVSELVSGIAVATEEQRNGILQVGEAVSQMDRVTQQNAALVEESAAAAESLRHQADKLVEVVARFRLAMA